MGFKQRERRRKKKTAMGAAQRAARRNGKSPDWWLTVTTRDTCCARCGKVLRSGGEMVYRAEPLEARCLLCADGLPYRPSVRWEQQRKRAA